MSKELTIIKGEYEISFAYKSVTVEKISSNIVMNGIDIDISVIHHIVDNLILLYEKFAEIYNDSDE